ncbi:MAG TPA: hypothetical protein VH300_05165 [Thermoleophilaceae bacterium]|nr:hypothetical protein [Thermoleophilaceae bacterium]
MTKRRTRIAAAVVSLALLAVAVVATGGSGESRGRPSSPFAWLHASSPPASWTIARTAGGATFSYPPGWTPIKTDPGTASVALLARGGRIDGFLNATPKQGAETLANWSHFRPQHNSDEGDRHERIVASTTDARFRAAHGSCVIDTYTTSKAAYREIACLVVGTRSTAVMVAAAPEALWGRVAPTLERAMSSFVP